MMLLGLIVGIAIVSLLVLIVTQIVMPLLYGRKLFPLFDKSPTAEQVIETRDEVEKMKNHNASLKELNKLEKERKRLEEEAQNLKANNDAN